SIRLTQFGKTLRSTSLDELPELFNIFKGDMSIVGPRPQLVRDMIFMTKQQRKRHSVFPGLTGWSQVNGRNIITWEEKIDFDLEYLQKISFRNDLKIVLKTVIKVLIKDGINMKNMDTAEDFGDYLLRNKAVTNNEYEYLIQQSRKLVNE
ncbi:MAG: sugar transferase, partial [Eubacterium sp.]